MFCGRLRDGNIALCKEVIKLICESSGEVLHVLRFIGEGGEDVWKRSWFHSCFSLYVLKGIAVGRGSSGALELELVEESFTVVVVTTEAAEVVCECGWCSGVGSGCE